MVRKPELWILFTLIASLLAAVPALAGGWAVITLDDLPGDIPPGQPLEISFTVRQHGTHPMDGLEPVVTLSHPGTGEEVSVMAEPGDGPGHYRAVLNLPVEGHWNWSIEAFTMNQQMPPLTVGMAPGPGRDTGKFSLSLPVAAGSLGMTIALASLGILMRKRARYAYALVLAGLMIGGLGFLSASAGKSSVAPPDFQTGSLEETGRQLFMAKGCVTCHSHDEIIRDRDSIYTDIGPDLSNFTADPAYLRSWLQDPASIKPETYMPDLELADGEIDALIDFLNSE